MAKVNFKDIKIGMTRSYSQTITDADIKTFAGFSGDNNPVHMSNTFAEQSMFSGRIAHGMLTASFFSALFGKELPGDGCVYVSQSLKFLKPVYVDSDITATITVTGKDDLKRRVFFNTECHAEGILVTTGEAELFVPK
jgi:3-hydroxybutyryl-CoA dehydratase